MGLLTFTFPNRYTKRMEHKKVRCNLDQAKKVVEHYGTTGRWEDQSQIVYV